MVDMSKPENNPWIPEEGAYPATPYEEEWHPKLRKKPPVPYVAEAREPVDETFEARTTFFEQWLSLTYEERKQLAADWGHPSPQEWSAIVNGTVVQQQQYEQEKYQNVSYTGLPEGWDYKKANDTDKLGPSGEVLPYGAYGWDAYGRPDYGPGPMGWIKRELAELGGIWQPSEEQIEAMKPDTSVTKELWAEGQYGKAALSWTGNLFQSIKHNWTKAEASDAGFLASLARGAGTVVSGAGEGLNQLARGIEKWVSPTIITGAEYIDRGKTTLSPQWDDYVHKIPVLSYPIRTGVNLIVGTIARLSEKEFENLAQEYKDAQIWRMGYSASIDATARYEFMRRVTQGNEDPRFVALDLENPVAEMWNQMIFDPLNLIGFIGKIGSASRWAKLNDALAIKWTKPIDNFIGITDDLVDVIKAGDQAAGATKINSIVDKFKSGMNAVRSDMVRLSQSRKIIGITKEGLKGALTHQGKIAVYGIDAGTFLNSMSQHFAGNTDHFLGALEAMVKIASNKTDEVVEGITKLCNITKDQNIFNMFTSDMGTKTAVILREMLVNPVTGEMRDITKYIGKLEDAGDLAKFAEEAGKRMNKALENIFPSLTDQIKATDDYAELVAKFGDESEEVINFLKRKPYANIPISKTLRKLDAAHQIAQKTIYRPAAAIQGILYMGLSPAYWLRNWWTNTAQVLVDQGPRAALRAMFSSPQRAYDDLTRYLGFIPESAKMGFGSAASFTGKKPANWWNYFSRRAAESEARAAAHVMATSVRDTFRKGLVEGRIIPPTTSLLNFGDDQRNLIVRLAQRYNGDADAVIKGIREASKTGGYDTARNLMFLNSEQIRILEETGVYNKLLDDILQSETLDDAIRKIADIREGYTPNAEDLFKLETHVVDDPVFGKQDEILNAIDETTEIPVAARESLKDLMNKKIHLDQISRDEYIQAVSDIEKEFDWMFSQQLDNVQFDDFKNTLVGDLEKTIEERILAVRSEHQTLREATLQNRDIARKLPQQNIKPFWNSRLSTAAPKDATKSQLIDAIWKEYFDKRDKIWTGYRDFVALTKESEAQILGKVMGLDDMEIAGRLDPARMKLQNARMLDGTEFRDGKLYRLVQEDSLLKSAAQRASEIGEATQKGGYSEKVFKEFLDRVFKSDNPEEALTWLDDTIKVTLEEFSDEGEELVDTARRIYESKPPPAEWVETTPPIIPMSDVGPAPDHNFFETTPIIQKTLDEVESGLRDNWGNIRDVAFTPQQEKELAEWTKTLRARQTEARMIAVDIAQQQRDFILHMYPKRYGIDLLLSYIYPYQFWHSRTYLKWMKRLVTEPEWIARYARYRQYLEKKHAGLPDWWKYQLNSNELLGLDAEHPLWFNLEATLNPLYGITGVDFTDPRRRLDWWSSTMEDLNKLGPTIWTPYQLAIALKYHMDGEEDAASRWAGRLWTGTRFIRDATALLGINEDKGIEVDPFVNFFSGGIDPYERARVGRMLGGMMTEGNYSPADIMDDAYRQQGTIWDEAFTRAVNERAPGQIAAFLLGAGFKPRSERDIQIDNMYNEIAGVRAMRDAKLLSDEEYRQKWDDLEAKYPFMDAVLLSKKGGLDRDEAYAWNVLGRIPPGSTDDIAERMGFNYEDLSSFYENSGDLSKMSEQQRLRFMAAILDISAILEIPPTSTKLSWDRASSEYRSMLDNGERLYGKDIWDKVDIFYATDDRDSYLKNNPVVEEALNWKQEQAIINPILSPYYTSIERIEKYLKGQMYDEAEELFGENLWDLWEVYHRIADIDNKAARQMWKDYPQLNGYTEFRDERLVYIAQRVAELGAKIPEAVPPVYREGQTLEAEVITPDTNKEAWVEGMVLSYVGGGRALPATVAPQPAMTEADFRQIMGEPLYNLWASGEELPLFAQRRLDLLETVYGINFNNMLTQSVQ